MRHDIESPTRFCNPETTLRTAVRIMRQNRCRALPVFFEGRPIGSISDREICFALAREDRPASQLLVWDAMFQASQEESGEVKAFPQEGEGNAAASSEEAPYFSNQT